MSRYCHVWKADEDTKALRVHRAAWRAELGPKAGSDLQNEHRGIAFVVLMGYFFSIRSIH